MLFFWIAVTLVAAAKFEQNFDTIRDGTRDSTIGDGARIQGRATVQQKELVLTIDAAGSGSGRIFVSPLPSSALGWTCSFKLRLSARGVPADGFALVWGNTDTFGVDPLVVQTWNFNRPQVRLAVWSFGTYRGGRLPGVWWWSSANPVSAVGNGLLLLSAGASVNATVFISWSPTRGLRLRSPGLGLIFKHDFDPQTQNSTHGWMLIGETGGLTQFLAIDDLVIEAPCGDCTSSGGTCAWKDDGLFECVRPQPPSTQRATTTAPAELVRCTAASSESSAACLSAREGCDAIDGEVTADSACAGPRGVCCSVPACQWSSWSPCECSPTMSSLSVRERTLTVVPLNWPPLPPCAAANETRVCCPPPLTLPTTSRDVDTTAANETAAANDTVAADETTGASATAEQPALEPWIIGVIAGGVALLCIVMVVAAIVWFKRSRTAADAPTEMAPSARSHTYGSLPQVGETFASATHYHATSQFQSLR